MIQPDALLDHARRLAGLETGQPQEADLRRGVSAAYYAVFHDLTGRAARYLIGSSPEETRSTIRRSWSHGEIATLAAIVVQRAGVPASKSDASIAKEVQRWGPLVDVAAADPGLVKALQLFEVLQVGRHTADYDHEAVFNERTLDAACEKAELARSLLTQAAPESLKALFALMTVRRQDFRLREHAAVG